VKPSNDQAERPRTRGLARPTRRDGPGARVRTGTREAGFSVRLERLVGRLVGVLVVLVCAGDRKRSVRVRASVDLQRVDLMNLELVRKSDLESHREVSLEARGILVRTELYLKNSSSSG
jgi:hypothetical protein